MWSLASQITQIGSIIKFSHQYKFIQYNEDTMDATNVTNKILKLDQEQSLFHLPFCIFHPVGKCEMSFLHNETSSFNLS